VGQIFAGDGFNDIAEDGNGNEKAGDVIENQCQRGNVRILTNCRIF
jgi:hypothetical protein